jgi:hypothetical protein
MKSAVRFTVMWLAAWCQVLVVATVPLAPIAMAAGPLDGIPICHAPDPADTGHQTPLPDHGQHDCTLCVMCAQLHAPAAVLTPSPLLPERQIVSSVRHHAAQPRAPPVRIVFAAQPRGPPSST